MSKIILVAIATLLIFCIDKDAGLEEYSTINSPHLPRKIDGEAVETAKVKEKFNFRIQEEI